MIYNMDFRKGIFHYNVCNVDLIVTSPPYLDARSYGGDVPFTTEEEWESWCFKSIKILSAILNPSGVIWWNTGSGYKDNHKLVSIYKLIVALEQVGIYLIDDIPWIKKSAPPKNIKNRPYPAWEHNLIFAPNPSLVRFYRDNVRRPYSPSTLSRMKYKLGKLTPALDGDYGEQDRFVKPNPGGASPPNYLLLPQDTSRRPHPAPMLPELANWAIRAYSAPGNLVFDPMSGIGTTWVESIRLGRDFIGFELVDTYIEIAKLSMWCLKNGEDPYTGLKEKWEKLHE